MGRLDRKFTVVVEGNIGCGKTTCLEAMKDFPGVELHKEPVENWRNVDGENMLAQMYNDPTRWSCTFQTYVQLTMLKIHSAKQKSPYKLMERSIFSARYCFVENLFQSGKMTKLEHRVISEYFDWLNQNVPLKPNLIVYLQTEPKCLHKRIQARARKEELNIGLDYLSTLHTLHEDWLIKRKFPVPCEVKVIDANRSKEQVQEDFHKIIEQMSYGSTGPLKEIQVEAPSAVLFNR